VGGLVLDDDGSDDVGSLEGSVASVDVDASLEDVGSLEDVVASLEDVDGSVVVEPVVVVLAAVVEGSSAGTTFTLSEDLSTLAAAAVTPPTPSATTAARATSLAVLGRIDTGAVPFSSDVTMDAIAVTASSSPARSSGRAG